MSKLPTAVSTSEFYLLAITEQVTRLADGVDRLVAALSVTSAPNVTVNGLDEERLKALLVAVKGIGAVTAGEIIASYKAGLDR